MPVGDSVIGGGGRRGVARPLPIPIRLRKKYFK